jgi:hypothetical protein
LKELEGNGFECLVWNMVQSLDQKQGVYRYLCKKRDTEIHMINYRKRNEFFIIKEISIAMVYTGNYFNSETEFESAFDEFDLRECISDDIVLYLPKQLIHFLAQTKTSRFIECNKKVAELYEKTFSNHSVISNDKKNYLSKGIHAMKSMMDKDLKQFWISDGTLLGWYRNCGGFAHFDDVDFTTWSKYASEKFTQYLMSNKEGFKVFYRFGFFDEAYELSFIWKDTKFDLFFNYIFEENYGVAGHYASNGSYSYYHLSKYFLCSADLFGVLVNVPCDPKTYVIEQYGKEWDSPAKKWDWDTSPFNKGALKYWSPDRKRKSFTEYRV